MSIKVTPCGGFKYDNSIFVVDKHNTLRFKPILERVSDYLYATEYSVYNYEDGVKAISKASPTGMCSAIRKNNLIGRNLDWYYDDCVNVVVKTKACQGRYATIGVAHTTLTKAQADNGEWNDYYNSLPFLVGDCVNEHGLYVSMNVVITDKGHTTGTNPNGKTIPQLMLPRYICDYAKDVDEAYWLVHDANIVAPSKDFGYEVHLMVCDKNNTYVMEFVNNQLESYSDENILTNFYLTDWAGDIKAVFLGDSIQDVIDSGLSDHAMGIERYKILSEKYYSIDTSTEDDIKDALKQVKYTLAYDENQSPYWYSEFVDKDLTIFSNTNDYNEIINKAISAFENRDRRLRNTWETCYSVIYDLNSKKLSVYSEEDFDNKFEFKLNMVGHL